MKRILLACPHGFCAGVRRAIEMAEAALQSFPPPLYCLKELVHNREVVSDLASRGVVFVSGVEEIPEGAVALFSAHGVSPEVRLSAARRRLNVVDATCPFVTKVHAEVRRFAGRGYTVLLVGDRDHDEIIGVAGEAPGQVAIVQGAGEAGSVAVADPGKVAVMTQTTLSVEEAGLAIRRLRERFPDLCEPTGRDICYATTNRQRAVAAVAREADLVLALGSANSANSRRLVEVAVAHGAASVLVSRIADITPALLGAATTVGLTAGASTPDRFVREAIARLGELGFETLEQRVVAEETLRFPLPRRLRAKPEKPEQT